MATSILASPAKTVTLKASVRLKVSPQTLFDFHSDPNNLSVVMPPTLKLVRLETAGPAQEGRLIELFVRDMYIVPMHWICRWKTVQSPNLLVDELLQGPFRLFVHEHHFEPDGNGGTIMKDIVTYAFGRSWWGRLISLTGVRIYLAILFAFRHWQTKRWVNKQSNNS